MPSNSLERDYATAWPLLETVLLEAGKEPSRQRACQELVQSWNAAHQIIAGGGPAGSDLVRRIIKRTGEALTSVDAFSFARGSFQGSGVWERLPWIEGNLYRVLRWIEAWDQCTTDAQRGKQATIALLLLRDLYPRAGRDIARHLSAVSDTQSPEECERACYLRVGSLLCSHDPTPKEVAQVIAPLAQRNPAAAKRAAPLNAAATRSARPTNPFLVFLNRLADRRLDGRIEQFSKQDFHSRGQLKTYARKQLRRSTPRLDPAKAGEPPIRWQVALDCVGVLRGSSSPAAHSYLLAQPHVVRRDKTKGKGREWDQDLHDFLCQDVREKTASQAQGPRQSHPQEGAGDGAKQEAARAGVTV
ncbi:MAG: hypothetical protein V2A79_03045 [Planctomycetota bacterium]